MPRLSQQGRDQVCSFCTRPCKGHRGGISNDQEQAVYICIPCAQAGVASAMESDALADA